jgi:hypothetical protein
LEQERILAREKQKQMAASCLECCDKQAELDLLMARLKGVDGDMMRLAEMTAHGTIQVRIFYLKKTEKKTGEKKQEFLEKKSHKTKP